MGEVIDIQDRLGTRKRRSLAGIGVVAAIMAVEGLGSPSNFKDDVEALRGLGLINNALPQTYLDFLRAAGVEIVTPIGNRSSAV